MQCQAFELDFKRNKKPKHAEDSNGTQNRKYIYIVCIENKNKRREENKKKHTTY